MKRLSVIGIALVAALALSAAAGASFASASQFRAQQYPTAVTSTQETIQKLTLGSSGINFKCGKATATATESAASSTLELAPAYSGCTLGGLAATVSTNGCQLTYTSTSESLPYTGTFGVKCSSGGAIEIKQSLCVVSIPAQSGVSGLEFSNAGSGSNRTVTATYGISGLSFSGGSGCQTRLIGSFSNGILIGSSVLKGSAGTRQIGVYLGNAQVENGPQFQTASYPSFVKTTEAVSFKWAFGGLFSFQCPPKSGTSTLTSSSTELQQSMVFEHCTAGGLEWKIAMNGCKFADYVSQPEGAGFVGGREIACSTGQSITLTQGTCIVTFPAQNVPGSVNYTNGEAGGLKKVSTAFKVTGLKYTGGSGCASNLIGAHEDGAMTGSWTLAGYNNVGGFEGSAISAWIQ